MGLFSKKKIEDLPKIAETTSSQNQVNSKEIDLVSSIKDEFLIIISGISHQSHKKLQITNESLGFIESKLHNIKIYQTQFNELALELQEKLLYMRGGSEETLKDDLAQDEQIIISYFKSVPKHLSSLIDQLRELRKLFSKLSQVPLDSAISPLDVNKKSGVKILEQIHIFETDINEMNTNLIKLYELKNQVLLVSKEHGIVFPEKESTPLAQPQQQSS